MQLQRLVTAFPDGTHGFGLLILRVSWGILGVSHGVFCVANADGDLARLLVGLVLAGSGALLMIGLFTSLTVGVLGLTTVTAGISLLHLFPGDLSDAPMHIALAVSVTIAIALLGPGAFSLDCRLFGRREILIPRPRPGEHQS